MRLSLSFHMTISPSLFIISYDSLLIAFLSLSKPFAVSHSPYLSMVVSFSLSQSLCLSLSFSLSLSLTLCLSPLSLSLCLTPYHPPCLSLPVDLPVSHCRSFSLFHSPSIFYSLSPFLSPSLALSHLIHRHLETPSLSPSMSF